MVVNVGATSVDTQHPVQLPRIMTDSVTDSTGSIRVDVLLRACAPSDVVEPLRETVTRARRLETAEIDADVRVRTWAPVRPALEALGDSRSFVSETVDAFRSWAEREGYSLRPAFERRKTGSMLGHRATAEIRVPTVCVAVYADDDLECVAPCSDGDRTYTVADCLARLEDGLTEPFPGPDERSSGRSTDTHARAEESE